ncbi:MAG: NERD domain-containing protein [Pirellulaceae bacterium]
MARVVGPVPADRWEREVVNRLKAQCPADWTVVADVKWALEKGGWVRSGQADAVVFAPGFGMAVLEVKGSRRIRVEDDGRWYRYELDAGRETQILIEEPPPAQADRNMHEIKNKLVLEGQYSNFPGRYASLAVYPQGEADRVPPMFDESRLVTHRHMGNLPSRIRHALERSGPGKRGEDMTVGVIDRMVTTLSNRGFTVTHVDSEAVVNEDVKAIEELTRHQFWVLRGLFEFPRVAVVGPAGSGKTLLAISHVEALASAERRVLFACFNRKLAESLRSKHPHLTDSIVNVDSFFLSMILGRQVPADTEARRRYFEEILPGLAFSEAARLNDSEKYDAIVVDEGQDFNELRVLALLELLKSNTGKWAIFADQRQDLFNVSNVEAIGADVVFSLRHNCRNTVQVNRATNALVNVDPPIESMPGMPEGEVPEIIETDTREKMAKEAWRLARRWAPEGGAVLLSPYRLERSCMSESRKGDGMALTQDLSELGKPRRVYFSTIRAFKGIEAPVVILLDVDIPSETPGAAFRTEDLYVACTRATARLAVLCRSTAAGSWFRRRVTGQR